MGARFIDPDDDIGSGFIDPDDEPSAQTPSFTNQLRNEVAGSPMDSFLSQIGTTVAKTGNALGLVGDKTYADWEALSQANSDMNPKASLAGDVVGLAGQAYLGGRGLQALGRLVPATGGPVAGTIANILNVSGRSLTAPQTLRSAAGAGAGFAAVTTPGDLSERATAGAVGAAGGALGYGAGKAIGSAGKALYDKAAQVAQGFKPIQAADLDAMITRLGITQEQYQSMPDAGQQALRKMVGDALQANKQITPEVAQRMADFQTAGITNPLKGWQTRDPMDWVQAHELQGVSPQVTQRWSNALQQLNSKIQGIAPNESDYALGTRFAGNISAKADELAQATDAAYTNLRSMAGKDLPLDKARFSNAVSTALDDAQAGDKLPPKVLNWINDLQTEPFTMDSAMRRFKSINGLIRNATDPQMKFELQTVKKHLGDAITGYGQLTPNTMPVPAGSNMGSQQAVADAFANARQTAKKGFDFEEGSKLHQMVTSGKFTPEKLPDLIKGITVNDLKAIAASDAQYGTNAIGDLRNAAAAYVRDAATLQGEMGGKYSQAGLRKALDQIGPENGRALFGARWGELNAILRAGGNIMNQPGGVIAANSGTGQMIARMMNALPVGGGAKGLALKGIGAMQNASAANNQLSGVQFKPLSLSDLMRQDLKRPGGASAVAGAYFGRGLAN